MSEEYAEGTMIFYDDNGNKIYERPASTCEATIEALKNWALTFGCVAPDQTVNLSSGVAQEIHFLLLTAAYHLENRDDLEFLFAEGRNA